MDGHVVALTNSIVRKLFASKVLLPTIAPRLLEFNFSVYNRLFSGRSRPKSTVGVDASLLIGVDEADIKPTPNAVASHEDLLW